MENYTQSVIENSRTWHDLNSLAQLRSQGDSKAAITEAAKQFESVFFSMMMKSMRDAANAVIDKPLFESPSLELFQDMYDKQLTLSVGTGTAEGSQLGLADVLVEQLTRGREFKSTEDRQTKTSQSEFAPANFMRPTSVDELIESKISTKQSQSNQVNNNNSDNSAQSEQSQTNTAIEIGAVSGPDSLTKTDPIEAKGMDFSTPVAFVNSLLPIAKQVADKLRMDPKLLIAQAALETGWGKFVMRTIDGVSSNNLFGIKADNAWQGDSTQVNTLEYEDGQLQQVKASFRSYANHEESFKDYVEFIQSNQRYNKALDVTTDAKNYLNELQNAGYATDPNYAEKIYQIYRSNSLNDAVNTASQQSLR